MMATENRTWKQVRLLSKEEAKHCIRRVLAHEPESKRSTILRYLHQVTINRFRREQGMDKHEPMDWTYKAEGKHQVDAHNEQLVRELMKEGFIKYEIVEKTMIRYRRKHKYTYCFVRLNEK